MPMFRKKPVVIEARLIADVNLRAIAQWCGGAVCLDDEIIVRKIRIKTLEGDMFANVGEWIIKEPFPTSNRKFYPCKPDIFEATYEAVGDDLDSLLTKAGDAAIEYVDKKHEIG